MARRNGSILDDLAKCPWWVSVVLSAAAFIGLRFILPLLIPSGPATSSNYAAKGLLGGLSTAAPFVALFLLIPAPIAAFRQWRERGLLERQDGLASIRALSWSRFEALIGEAYRRQGYSVSRPSGSGPDGGIDLVLRKDGNTLLVQCKQWKSWKVGVKVIREMYGVLTDRNAHGAIIVTSGIFTQEARAFAEGKPIDLVEGEQLAALIRSAQGVPSASSASRPSKPAPASRAVSQPAIQEPSSKPESSQKRCPQCGHSMVLRTAQRGPQTGQQFWGCSQFPRCRATLPIVLADA
ncbi:MAG: restriction endonuclease [Bryobacteraceae bacterium]